MEKRAINILMLSVFMLLAVMLMPVRVSAETETDTAPTVMYKLINHDCIKLKWDEVAGADGYYIYRTDTGTGKTVKYKSIVKGTDVTIKNLSAETEYIFYVEPISGKNGKMTVGQMSAGTKLTTPLEWYYSVTSNSKGHILENPNIIFRYHYNDTSEEIIDSSELVKSINTLISDCCTKLDDELSEEFFGETKTEHISRVKNSCWIIEKAQTEDYVYFDLFFEDPLQDNEILHFIIQTQNNVRDVKFFPARDFNNQKELFLKGKNFRTEVHYFNSEYKDDVYSVFYINTDSKNFKIIFDKDNYLFTNLVSNNNYIYFIAEPVNLQFNKTKCILYCYDCDDNSISELCKFSPIEDIKFSDHYKISIDLISCNIDYCSYHVSFINSDKNIKHSFYSLSLVENSFKSEPEFIKSINLYSIEHIVSYNNSIYFEGKEQDTIQPQKTKSYYYCLDTESKRLIKSNKPFEWYY